MSVVVGGGAAARSGFEIQDVSIDELTLEVVRSCHANIAFLAKQVKKSKLIEPLFKMAVDARDVLSQIELVKAEYELLQCEESGGDIGELESKSLSVWSGAFSLVCALDARGVVGINVITEAASFGYLQAQAELIYVKWGSRESLCYLSELRQLVGKGVSEVDYRFGLDLKRASIVGTAGFYEGMAFMQSSFGIPVLLCGDEGDFERFKSHNYFQDGFVHLHSGRIVTHSLGDWRNFLEESLQDREVRSKEDFLFYNKKEIKVALTKFSVCSGGGEFLLARQVRRSVVLVAKTAALGYSIPGIYVERAFVMHKKGGQVGVVKAFTDEAGIYESFENEEAAPLIAFLEGGVSLIGSLDVVCKSLTRLSSL